jgi:hypothetical protein
VEAGVHSRGFPCGICSGKSGTRRDFPCISVSPCEMSCCRCPPYSLEYHPTAVNRLIRFRSCNRLDILSLEESNKSGNVKFLAHKHEVLPVQNSMYFFLA